MALQNVPVNQNNLVRWYSNTTPTIGTSQYSEGLHNGYLHRWRAQPSLLPVLVGDTLTIYTNFDSDVVGANTFKIAENNVVIDDVSLYDITATPWGDNNHKIEITIPVTNERNNIKFNIVIVEGEDDEIQYESNCFLVRQLTEQNINNTHLIKFYHNNDVYDYEWGIYDVLLDTPYTIRVSSSIRDIVYNQEKTIYTEATTGRPRKSREINSKTYSLEIYFNDEQLHDGLSVGTSFKYLEINGKQYICESYEVEFQPNLNIFKGVATLKDISYQKRLTVCAPTLS
jgi:hypothetical protein